MQRGDPSWLAGWQAGMAAPAVSWLPLLCQQLYKLRIENKPPANANANAKGRMRVLCPAQLLFIFGAAYPEWQSINQSIRPAILS